MSAVMSAVYKYAVGVNGEMELGYWEACSPEEAVEKCVLDAGYASIADMEARGFPNDLEAKLTEDPEKQ